MNKLYSQSMCSVKQWRAYQNAEALVSAEVDEVRVEADEIEPGWSQVCKTNDNYKNDDSNFRIDSLTLTHSLTTLIVCSIDGSCL